MSYRTYRSVSGTGIDVVPNLPKLSGIGIDVVENLTKRPVPVLMLYRTYQSVRYRYESRYRYRRYRYSNRTELAEVSGTGNDLVLNLLKCRYR